MDRDGSLVITTLVGPAGTGAGTRVRFRRGGDLRLRRVVLLKRERGDGSRVTDTVVPAAAIATVVVINGDTLD
jgi:hypothetical protein